MASRQACSGSHCGSGLGPRHGVLVFACVAALALPATAWAGADVAALQVALRIHGAHRGAVDGILGPETRAAIRRFQREHGLVVDGVVGPRTRRALGRFARHPLGSRALRGGMHGWDVAALQYLLTRCELDVGAIDGSLGAHTRSAVVRYQRRAHLAVDGVAGDATVASLRRLRACRHTSGAVPQGATVSGIDIGGMSATGAAMALRSVFAKPLRLHARGQTLLADPQWLARAEIYAAVKRALRARSGTNVRLRVAVHMKTIRGYAASIDERVCDPPRDARLVGLRSFRPEITPARSGCHAVRSAVVREIVRRVRGFDRSSIRIPLRRVRPEVTRARFGPVVVIRRASHRLYLYQGVHKDRVLPVGTGRASSPTPLGRFTIVTKIRRPWWYPPEAGWAHGLDPIPPGPGNPLGTRWMGLSASGVGIHGTPDRASVGYSRSHGCVRMFPRHAEWLFPRVRVRTPVFIVAA